MLAATRVIGSDVLTSPKVTPGALSRGATVREKPRCLSLRQGRTLRMVRGNQIDCFLIRYVALVSTNGKKSPTSSAARRHAQWWTDKRR